MSFPSSELGPPISSTASLCVPPPGTKWGGGGTLPAGEGSSEQNYFRGLLYLHVREYILSKVLIKLHCAKDETILANREGGYYRKKPSYRNQCHNKYDSRILSWVLREYRPNFFVFCFFVWREGLSFSTVNKYRIQFLCQKHSQCKIYTVKITRKWEGWRAYKL